MGIIFERYDNGNLRVILLDNGYYRKELSRSVERLPDDVAYIKTEYLPIVRKLTKCRLYKNAHNNSAWRQAIKFACPAA